MDTFQTELHTQEYVRNQFALKPAVNTYHYVHCCVALYWQNQLPHSVKRE